MIPFTGNFCGSRGDAEEKLKLVYSDNSVSDKRERFVPLKAINIAPLSSCVFDCCTVFDI